jgi:hypothetical protein
VKRLKALALSAMVVGVIGGMGAPAASAAEGDGTATVDCTSVTFSYTGWGEGTHVVQETVWEDAGVPLWNRLAQVEFTFEGDSATHKVDLDLPAGTHQIFPDAWQLNAPDGDNPHLAGFIPPPGTTLTCNAPATRPTGFADVDCTSVTYNYSGFGEGTHTVEETVYEDTGQPSWDKLEQVQFTFEGDSAIHKVDISLGDGTHTIRPDAWELNPTRQLVGEEPHVKGFIPPPPTTVACGSPRSNPSGTAAIDCTGATFHYSGFGAGTHVIQETVYEDLGQPLWNRLRQVEFTFQGDSATHKVDLTLGPGHHTIRPDAWELNVATGNDPHVAGFVPPPGTSVDCGSPTPRDPKGSADVTCDAVTFNYTGFGAGTHVIQETVYEDTGLPLWNRLTQVEFTFTGDAATHAVRISPGSGSHTIRRDAWQLNPPPGEHPHIAGFIPPPPTTVDCGTAPCTTNCGPAPCTTNCGPAPCTTNCGPAPCPSGKVDMRWHYAPSGSSGSWSTTKSGTCPSTLTFDRQAMSGDLKVNPGTQIKVGYMFRGAKGSFTVSPKVDFTIRCADGKVTPSQSTWTVTLPTQTYSVPGGSWWPTDDKTSSSSYQGRAPIPDFCRGGKVRLDRGGVFTAKLS